MILSNRILFLGKNTLCVDFLTTEELVFDVLAEDEQDYKIQEGVFKGGKGKVLIIPLNMHAC